MKCTFACKKVSLNDSIKEYTEKKVSKLDRYFQEEPAAFVTFSVEKNHLCTVELTIRGGNTIFRAQTDFNGEKYAKDWQLATNRNILVANVFNATSHWRVVAVEDGKEYLMRRISSKGQDAFAAGYHHKYSKSVSYRFVSMGNG